MDISKISERVLIVFAVCLTALVIIFFTRSDIRNEPFSINGKEFGFGTGQLAKKTAEVDELKKRLNDALAENQQLKQANAAFVAERQERERQASAMWFHVESIEFHFQDDSFTTAQGRNGIGTWTSRESELRLALLESSDSELVLGTNLADPANKIRIPFQKSVLVPMKNYDYRITVVDIQSNVARVRVERRNKQPSP